MHSNSKQLFTRYARDHIKPGLKLLEIGPDGMPSTFRTLADVPDVIWDTLDITDDPRLTYPRSPGHAFPVPDSLYDLVLSGSVLEHVKKPWRWFPEVARVTRPGGLVITISPVSWPYHETPVDCWRIYPEGMKALYEEAGLDVLHCSWESLETPQYRRFFPWASLETQSRRLRLFYRLLGAFGFPIPRAYDTITIGRKP